MLFKEIAEPLAARGVPVIPLRPKTKIAFIKGWENLATTDQGKIGEWDQEYPDANAASVAYAKPEGIWFFEVDKENFHQEIERQTGQKFPATFIVRSSPGRGHFYFKQTPASIAMGNVQGKDQDGKEAWSARVDNRYVVAPGSYHPTSGRRYEILRDVPIVEAPDWLVNWLASKKSSDNVTDHPKRTGHVELDSSEPIAEGGRNNALTSILGKARQVLGMDKEQLFAYGLVVNSQRCRPPLSETEIRTIAYSVGKYDVVPSAPVPFAGYQQQAPPPDDERPKIEAVPYPVFPRWVIKGTSVGDGLVKPICDVNNSYPEFIFMPAMVLMLNYLGTKVGIKNMQIVPSFYLVSIGWKGRAFKSSGVKAAIEHLKAAGACKFANGGAAEGKTLIWTAGSTEGLGQDMTRTNCKNAVLFYDEFSTLVKKASIDRSSMLSHLLLLYESALFQNTKSGRRENFSHEQMQYCASFIACTTDKGFLKQWGSIPNVEESGLKDRFFLLYQPEVKLPMKVETYVNTTQGAVLTKDRLTKALDKKEYEISDSFMLEQLIEKHNLDSREVSRLLKMALFFAVDMGKDEVDESCLERARDLVLYGRSVWKYLKTFESENFEGNLQQQIIHALQTKGGASTERELFRAIHPERYGPMLWKRVYQGMQEGGWIQETGKGSKGDPKQIILLRLPEEDDE